jgi:hypothetical protein
MIEPFGDFSKSVMFIRSNNRRVICPSKQNEIGLVGTKGFLKTPFFS